MQRKTIKEEVIAIINSALLAWAFVAGGAVLITFAVVGISMLKAGV